MFAEFRGGGRRFAPPSKYAPGTDPDASVNLCLSILQPEWTTTTMRTEQNSFVRSGKSEANY